MIPANFSANLMMGLGIYFLVRFVLLSGSLWVLLRAQDLNYTVPSLLVSAALASICDMIPLMGHPLAASVLLLCVLKMTGAHLVDVRFTVVISYAIMFFVQMMVLSAIPTPMPVHARSFASIFNPNVAMTAKEQAAEDRENADLFGVKAKPTTVPATKPKAATNAASATIAAVIPAQPPVTPAQKATQTAEELTKNWKLKGILGSGPRETAMIVAGGKTYTFGIGETLKITTGGNKLDVSMDEATQQYVVLSVNGVKIALTLH